MKKAEKAFRWIVGILHKHVEKKTIKRYILRFNQANPESAGSFRALQLGTKKVETRAATKKYKTIGVGDTLVFVCGKERCERRIRAARFFKSIDEMLGVYRVKDIMPDCASKKELEDAYYSYSGYREKIIKFGLMAWRV